VRPFSYIEVWTGLCGPVQPFWASTRTTSLRAIMPTSSSPELTGTLLNPRSAYVSWHRRAHIERAQDPADDVVLVAKPLAASDGPHRASLQQDTCHSALALVPSWPVLSLATTGLTASQWREDPCQWNFLLPWQPPCTFHRRCSSTRYSTAGEVSTTLQLSTALDLELTELEALRYVLLAACRHPEGDMSAAHAVRLAEAAMRLSDDPQVRLQAALLRARARVKEMQR
jgi:hypothetical protein